MAFFKEIFCVQFYLELPQSYLLRFPSQPTFFSVTVVSKSSSYFSHFCEVLRLQLSVPTVCSCYLPKLGENFNLLERGQCGPNKLELSLGVDSGMIPAACLLIFKRKHIISRVEADLLRKINRSLTALIKLTNLVRVSSMLLTDHQLEGAYVKTNVGSDWCVAFHGGDSGSHQTERQTEIHFPLGFD